MLRAKFSGRLNFLGADKPWWLSANENGQVNLWPIFEKKFLEMKKEKVALIAGMESISIKKNEISSATLACNKIGGKIFPTLMNSKRIGATNIMPFISNILFEINGRIVNFEANEEGISLSVDPSEKIFRLPFCVSELAYKVPKGKEVEICKLNKDEPYCIFLGFCNGVNLCSKFVSWGRTVLNYYADGRIGGRIGNCGLSK
ncbi:hypothetical protein L6251_00295 [Candidatus Parcubacteria bacterium]|nr:hypothetical protein [Candidatus Parcubacteria bacterium]